MQRIYVKQAKIKGIGETEREQSFTTALTNVQGAISDAIKATGRANQLQKQQIPLLLMLKMVYLRMRLLYRTDFQVQNNNG